MPLERGKEHFTKAVRILVDEPGGIRERLLIAYVSQLSALDSRFDVPEDMASAFEAIKVRLGQDQVPGDRGNPASQLKKVAEEEACQIAGRIFSMFLRLHDLSDVG